MSFDPRLMQTGMIPRYAGKWFKAGVHLKAVFQLGIKLSMQISRLRFKQSRISMLISHIHVLDRCVNFFGDF